MVPSQGRARCEAVAPTDMRLGAGARLSARKNFDVRVDVAAAKPALCRDQGQTGHTNARRRPPRTPRRGTPRRAASRGARSTRRTRGGARRRGRRARARRRRGGRRRGRRRRVSSSAWGDVEEGARAGGRAPQFDSIIGISRGVTRHVVAARAVQHDFASPLDERFNNDTRALSPPSRGMARVGAGGPPPRRGARLADRLALALATFGIAVLTLRAAVLSARYDPGLSPAWRRAMDGANAALRLVGAGDGFSSSSPARTPGSRRTRQRCAGASAASAGKTCA